MALSVSLLLSRVLIFLKNNYFTGPGEFAEGLVIGVRSVFSGVVGGAAGSVSKIFSGVGKGLAALTFDSDFQKQRRKQLKKRADQNFGAGMTRNTIGLAKGIFEGVTGVATKPIQGARQEGVGGFFKGKFFYGIYFFTNFFRVDLKKIMSFYFML